jgi:hypothetical protein
MRSRTSLIIPFCTITLIIATAGGCGKSEPLAPAVMVKKLDGSTVPLADLEGICQDVVYNKAKIIKHQREGNQSKADEARAYFKSFSADLKEFAPTDRDACMDKFDTPANIAKYQ